MDIDEPLLLFRAQYLQCIDHDFLTWPPPALLKQPDAQSFLFKRLFDTSRVCLKPPISYELKILRTLVPRIRKATSGTILDSQPYQKLSGRLTELEKDADTSESLWKQDAYMTYNCARVLDSWHPITLHESRSLISGSQHTGHRTWQGALHLATFLLADQSLVLGKRVLELGAGTGFLSILCQKYLHAGSVVATDGEERVVKEMHDNLVLNGLDDGKAVAARRLWWGSALAGNWNEVESLEGRDFDLVLGADIIYQKDATRALVEALRALLDLRPRARILLSNALRFPDVFEVFTHDCERNNLTIHVLNYEMISPSKQKSLFYSTAMPLQIVEIKDCRDKNAS